MERRILEWADARLVFSWLDAARGYGYELQVKHGADWRAISAAGNPLARGRSFDLFPQRITALPSGGMAVAGERAARGADGATRCYTWSGQLTPAPDTGWLHVDLELDIPAPLELQMVGGVEPEVTVDLGPLPPYERGDHVWFKTGITNPTKWNDEAYGNDFPGAYYYDPYLRAELLLFFDMTVMDWMGFGNIARFLNYRIGFRRRYRPAPAAEVGLYADGFSGTTFPAGRQRIAYWIAANHRDEGEAAPTEQQAVAALIRRSLDLVPPPSPWPEKATSWRDLSLGCALDMNNNDHAWRRAGQEDEFILNYVDAQSPAWEQVAAARRRPFNNEFPCLESALWGAYPLLALTPVDRAPEFAALQTRLLRFMDRLLRGDRLGLLGGPAESFGPGGTWQYVCFLEELWQVAVARRDDWLKGQLLAAVETVLLPLAANTNYLFPLIFDKVALRKVWNGDNYSIGGLFAVFMLALHEGTGEARYLDEARRALRALANLPVNALSQEAFLTSCAVQASHRLYVLTGEREWADLYDYLLAQALRLVYWYSDRTSPEARAVNILGMVHACTPIIYSALFENIDTLARLAPTFKTFAPHPGVLRLFDHARRNNFYCYPACLPEEWHSSPLKYIPHENIPLLEGPNSTPVGQEIYGAGFTFRAYLLWEALASCSDRDVMVLNLESYEEPERLADETGVWHFLVFNPEAASKRAEVVFPLSQGRAATVMTGMAFPLAGDSAPLAGGRLAVTLAPGEALCLQLTLGPR